MSDQQDDSLSGEFKRLGENLKFTIRTAWQSDERKNVSRSIEDGLSEFTRSLEDVSSEIRTSETSQKIKEDLKDFQTRISTGEVESKLRSELVASLKIINAELAKFTNRWSPQTDTDKSNASSDDQPNQEDPENK